MVNKKENVPRKGTHTLHTLNTDNTLHTLHTDKAKKLTVSTVLCSFEVAGTLFSDKIFEKILQIFAVSGENFTYEELGEKLGKDQANIRQVINGNKEHFMVLRSNGRKVVIQLTQLAIDEIKDRITSYEAEIERNKARILKEKEAHELRENYELEVIKFIQDSPMERSGQTIIIDFNKLSEYNPTLADSLLDEPLKFIEIIKDHFDDCDVKILNIPSSNTLSIEDLRKEQEDKVVCISGRVASFGEVRPLTIQIDYECPSCGTILNIIQNYRLNILTEPKRCSCGRRGNFHEVSRTKVNSSVIQLEDLQDETDNPHTSRMKSILFNHLCDKNEINKFSPGNELKVVGILKEVPVFKMGKRTVFDSWIFEIFNADLIEEVISVSDFTKEEIFEIKNLSYRIDEESFEALLSSYAPEVYGYDEIKSALILQGCNKKNSKSNNSIRSKSNILLIGDPGVAKSVLGNFALDVTAGSRKAVGGGSSAVGITASVIKEEDSMGGYRVEPGALVLAKELFFLDELNNLTDDDKPKLQEGMSEGMVSINKANIHIKMSVTCGVLAAANPKRGHFVDDSHEAIQSQFNLPTPILNRFDTIFVIKDKPDSEVDKQIARNMLKRHKQELKPTYDKLFLKKFFTYIRNFPEPIIDGICEKHIEEIYDYVRTYCIQGVKINPRFLESLTRMIIASAKLRQSRKVEIKDIERVLQILGKSQYKLSKIDLMKIKLKQKNLTKQ